VPNVTSERLAVGLVFVVIGLLACLAPTQSDTWWHLRAGQDIWRTGSIPLHDGYSYTATGAFWPNHEWLTQAIFYPLYWVGGMPLLTGFCATLIVVALSFSWRLTEGAFEVRFLLFAACLATGAGGWAIRPQMFSLAAFMLTCALLVANRPLWLPPIFVVWTNLHGAVALGVVAVLAALLADTIAHRRVSPSLAGAAAGCLLATCLSPLGFHFWPEIIASMQRSQIYQLSEWQSPGFSPALWPFWVVATALPVAAIVWRSRLDARTMTLTAIALAMLPLALRSMRNVSVFLLVAVPALTALARPRDRAARVGPDPKEHGRVNAGILIAAASMAAAVVALAWLAPAPLLGWRPITAPAIGAIATCADPIYNTYGEGGVLIWFAPQKRVFIDNRQDPYSQELLRANHRLEFEGDYHELFNQYGVRCAVVPPTSPITHALRADPAWSVNYTDDRWTVLTRR
jgi:hypothetical protein